jgi:hypothetical protein
MADPSHQPEATTPRWVKALGIVTAVLVLMAAGHLFTSGGLGLHALPSDLEHGARP